jgi:hypothetical protein
MYGNYTVRIKDGRVTLSKVCSITGEVFAVVVLLQDFDRWKEGTYAQDVWPHLDAPTREFIISGITPAEWDALFAEEDERSAEDEALADTIEQGLIAPQVDEKEKEGRAMLVLVLALALSYALATALHAL